MVTKCWVKWKKISLHNKALTVFYQVFLINMCCSYRHMMVMILSNVHYEIKQPELLHWVVWSWCLYIHIYAGQDYMLGYMHVISTLVWNGKFVHGWNVGTVLIHLSTAGMATEKCWLQSRVQLMKEMIWPALKHHFITLTT